MRANGQEVRPSPWSSP